MPFMGWLKASGCESGACVEICFESEMIGVRNSKIPGETVWFDTDEWQVFITGVKAGDFDHLIQVATFS